MSDLEVKYLHRLMVKDAAIWAHRNGLSKKRDCHLFEKAGELAPTQIIGQPP
jgi:hypothetical protein